LLIVRVQRLVLAPERLPGLHVRPAREAGATRVRPKFFATPFSVAVIVAVASTATAAAFALNEAVVWPAGTVTVPGTVTDA
jgi:hypothetical protein